MLLRLYNDDSPLIGLPNDKTDEAAKGSALSLKDGSAKAEDNRTLNGTGVDHDGRRDNTSSKQGDD
jgi:hypothetical protein